MASSMICSKHVIVVFFHVTTSVFRVTHITIMIAVSMVSYYRSIHSGSFGLSFFK